MSLQKRLVAVVALLLVVGLVVADVVTYASVHSFLYGQADNTLAQNESLGFQYLTYAAERGLPVNEANLSRRISADVYVQLMNHSGHVVLSRPSGPIAKPDPAPILTKDIPVQQVPDIDSRVRVGRYAGTFRPDPDAVVLGSTGDPDGRYRTVAVSVPQGTLVTSISLNPTNDTLASLRKVELIASLAVLLAMGVLVFLVVRRGLRPLRQMAGTADAIASGDLARRVPEGNPGTEVGRLGSALNQMLTQIEGAFAEKSASEERLRQFVADASHELRTPLTSIRGYAELLGRGGFSDEAGRQKALKRIEEEATRMGGLVEDLLLLAELDRGRPLRSEPVDLHRVCADAVDDSNAVPHDRDHGLHPRVRQRARDPAREGGPGLRPLLPGRSLPLGVRDRARPRHRAGHRRGPARDRVGGDVRPGRCDHAGRDPAGRHARRRGDGRSGARALTAAALRRRVPPHRARWPASRWPQRPRRADPSRPRRRRRPAAGGSSRWRRAACCGSRSSIPPRPRRPPTPPGRPSGPVRPPRVPR
jgi:two-component system OmpR family sensor kinase